MNRYQGEAIVPKRIWESATPTLSHPLRMLVSISMQTPWQTLFSERRETATNTLNKHRHMSSVFHSNDRFVYKRRYTTSNFHSLYERACVRIVKMKLFLVVLLVALPQVSDESIRCDDKNLIKFSITDLWPQPVGNLSERGEWLREAS